MAKGYWMVHITVTDPELYPEYKRLASPVIAGFGGTYLVRGGSSETTEGQSKDRHVIIEFPDLATAQACFESKGYQDAAKIRRQAGETDFVIVEGNA